MHHYFQIKKGGLLYILGYNLVLLAETQSQAVTHSNLPIARAHRALSLGDTAILSIVALEKEGARCAQEP